MLKNRQLLLNTVTRNLKVFIKFSHFAILILFVACKSDNANKGSNSETKSPETETEQAQTNSSKKILFFGDSLSAGYGLEDVNDAFPGIIQDKIDALQLDYTVVNSGVSGETTSGGKNRIEWVLNEEPAIFILELGANDGLRGVPLQQTKENLQYIIDAVKTKYPSTKIILAGMQLPPNMGQTYSTEFQDLFPSLAEKNDVYLIPFLLENVGGVAALNQSDGIHPTKEGHEILATNVWNVLKPIIK
ncbi:acyl-CoA thioesterase-1 [Flavobacterium sp. PL11]|uniref:arylesterase n=1 Tax=Flavobacterium sp. PL11 TaxID=3071717 RepID=UPI002E0B2AD2|nr:acyl-CoA thioesterase-1 [Flavobacterium sp. PL11]